MPQAKNKTTIVNTSGSRRYFDFLPPAGLSLDPGQEYSQTGEVNTWRRYWTEAHDAEYNAALDAGDIEIKETPAPILYDETDEVSLEVSVDAGALEVVQPSSIPTTTAP